MRKTNKQGFTLIELILVVVVSGMMLVFAVPRIANSLQRTDVEGARTRTVALFNLARANAIESNRHASLLLTSTTAMITAQAPGGGTDTLALEDFSAYGVNLASSRTSITLDPRGVAMGLGSSTAIIVLSKGSYADTVQITGFGRVIAQ